MGCLIWECILKAIFLFGFTLYQCDKYGSLQAFYHKWADDSLGGAIFFWICVVASGITMLGLVILLFVYFFGDWMDGKWKRRKNA